MRKFILISAIIITAAAFKLPVSPAKYYVSNTGSNSNNGLSPGAAWATIAKVNATSMGSGDSVFFERGGTFTGPVIPSSNGIAYDAYGSGENPVITGFTTLTGWTNSGSGIWKKNIPGASNSLSVVAINNNLQRLGRYPNADAANGGYLTYEAINSATPYISDYQLPASPNWTGAEMAIRKKHWIIDRCRVTAQNGTNLSYINPVQTNTYYGAAGYGYFFQDDIRTLDQFGEWFLNKSTKDLSVYFGITENPTSYNIKVSTVDTLFNCGGGASGRPARSNIKVKNISFEGANKTAFYAWNGSNISITNCAFNNNNDGIFLWNIANSLTDGNTITNCLNNGIGQFGQVSSPTVITNNTVRKCGLFAGMGASGDGSYNGIRQSGNNSTIEYNRVDSAGYLGIEFTSSNVNVRYNYVTSYCMTKDDGGGIYTWSNDGKTTYSNRVVSYNTVLNGSGAAAGAAGTPYNSSGIYLDGGANNVNVLNNTISGANNAGIFGNNIVNVRLTGNVISSVPKAISVQRFAGSPLVRNVTVTSNILYPTNGNFFYWNAELNVPSLTTIQADMRAIGTFDSNYYRNDIAAPFDYFYHLTSNGVFVDPPHLTFTPWTAFISGDANSRLLPVSSARFEYNETGESKTISLDGQYQNVVSNATYTGSVTLDPYSSILIVKVGQVCTNCLISNKIFIQ